MNCWPPDVAPNRPGKAFQLGLSPKRNAVRTGVSVLAAFRDALPAGSYLALSHATADFRPAAAQQAAAVYDQATSPVTLRTRAQVATFFDGWDLVEPGLVQVPLWRPDGKPPRPRELDRVWVYGGVARKSP
jgi:hypothetical protein